ncbi:MAG: hypothetical protein ACI9KA_001834 [Parasphingorhabdus sp.]|uniref:hypothetical protein n=1 Tax=Parasphingorhabdus sp. TaxID=2709688 RepID=UPI0039E426AE
MAGIGLKRGRVIGMVSKNRIADLAIVSLLALSFIFLLNVFEYFYILLEIPYILLAILVAPFFEELYKYFFAKKFREKAFLAILVLAIFEIFIVKIPLLLLSYNGEPIRESIIPFLIPLSAFIFHVSTALNYVSIEFTARPQIVFLSMVVLHCVFNSVSYLNVDLPILFVCATLVSFTPYFLLILSRKIFS